LEESTPNKESIYQVRAFAEAEIGYKWWSNRRSYLDRLWPTWNVAGPVPL